MTRALVATELGLVLSGCAELEVALRQDPIRAELLRPDEGPPVAAEAPAPAAVDPELTLASTPETAPEPPAGQAVATVGPEAITLPQLTAEVKARLAELPGDAKPTRRQVIAVARSTLELLVLRALVMQEAAARYPEPGRLDALLAEIDRRWADQELPRLLGREGVADEPALAAKLAADARTVSELREVHRLRQILRALMAAEPGGSGGDLVAYLDGLRRKTPVTTVMSESELAARGEAEALREAESAPAAE